MVQGSEWNEAEAAAIDGNGDGAIIVPWAAEALQADFKRAGSDLVRELSHKVEQIHIDHGHNRLHTSDVVVTTGGLLNAKFVLHVVGKSSL